MTNPFANSIKLLTIINLLASPSGATVKIIMERLNISRRTAFRFLGALSELGFPLTDEQSKPKIEKTYRLMDSYILKLPNLDLLDPGLNNQELELLLNILNHYETQPIKKPVINTIRAKLKAFQTRVNEV